MTVRETSAVGNRYRVVGDVKAELVGGKLVVMAPTGDWPASAAGAIYASLREYARRTRAGRAYGDNVGFLVDLPNRQSFSPDAAFHTGPRTGMKFLEGAPVFAVEVRSEGEHGPGAERAIEAKRGDYFAAATIVVWDVELVVPDVVRVYRAGDPHRPAPYRRGEVADAEPAVAGWTFPVDDLFE
jgi:Uma2 family endonuclease